MSVLYALLVGIDTYRMGRWARLAGARNDVVAAAAVLRGRAGGRRPEIRELYDDDATRAAVIDGLRHHLGRAGPGDTALFWFSGHGSEAEAPPELRHVEAGPTMQTLVCADSRTGGVPDLLDKELSLLLDDLAERGAHVAVVLDGCHSGGATRSAREKAEPGVRVRALPAGSVRDLPGTLLPELGGRPFSAVGRSAAEHVALAAARRFELAEERWLDGAPRGLFSWALLRALNRLGGTATYRQLLVAARAEVELYAYRQVPQLYPDLPGLADAPFLGGAVTSVGTGMIIRYAAEGWELDAGACHGLRPVPDGADVLRVAVHGDPSREARVARVLAERSLVVPLGWEPDRERQYDVVLSRVELPATVVAIGGRGEDHAGTARG
ncbi:caspase family protein [Catenuloplanes atrovinosus]|uniref:Peptidase C14 caspase domain-containing protein n=1 Tax=Catenuloplanes atrovinosus TaxID=137266 RepID=A0AAE3YUY0_9ACTN|nr:caspase family protein [Catenuloplanes atrovinosus]MDR7279121.1 hypothetical protein [Catenuloplanes atrovinosus]